MSSKSLSAHPIRIRIENTGSIEERVAIRAINQAAFGGSDEADLVDKLREGHHALISLVAEIEANIAGHIMFSRMRLTTPATLAPDASFAPAGAVSAPQRQ